MVINTWLARYAELAEVFIQCYLIRAAYQFFETLKCLGINFEQPAAVYHQCLMDAGRRDEMDGWRTGSGDLEEPQGITTVSPGSFLMDNSFLFPNWDCHYFFLASRGRRSISSGASFPPIWNCNTFSQEVNKSS